MVGVSIVFDADEEVDCVVGDFEGFVFWFEVECAESAGGGPAGDEFGIEVKDEVGGAIDDAEIGVSGALVAAGASGWDVAGEGGIGIEMAADSVFEKAGCFVDAAKLADRGVWLVELCGGGGEREFDSRRDAAVGR